MLAYFSKFGHIFDVSIKKDAATGNSKGFGFINCSEESVYDEILGMRHRLGGKRINCNNAFEDIRTNHIGNNEQRKVFLRGITADICDEDLEAYFKQFGRIVRIYGLRDAADGKTKNFGFLEFYEVKDAANVISQKYHLVAGIQIKALPFLEKIKEAPGPHDIHPALNM